MGIRGWTAAAAVALGLALPVLAGGAMATMATEDTIPGGPIEWSGSVEMSVGMSAGMSVVTPAASR